MMDISLDFKIFVSVNWEITFIALDNLISWTDFLQVKDPNGSS